MNFKAGAILVAALLSSSVVPLRATSITSTTVPNWLASTTGPVHDVDFTHIAFINYGPSGYTSTDGFNITGPDGASTFLRGLSFNGFTSLEGGNDANAQVLVTTPSGGDTALLVLIGSS